MNRFTTLAVLVVLVLMVGSGAGAAGKITVDPNSGSAAKPVSKEREDPRLAQKITYQGGYKRLHDALAEISDRSRVKLYCGRTNSDWPVRDIPMVVCVTDIPLGKLLKSIADASHTVLASSVADSGDKSPRYRMFRDKKTTDEIAAGVEARRQARIARAVWGWDALVKFGQNPNAESLGAPRHRVLLAKILASLGPDARQQLLAGEKVQVNASSAQCAGPLRELYLIGWQQMKLGNSQQEEPLPDDVRNAQLAMTLQDGGETGLTDAFANLNYYFRRPPPPGMAPLSDSTAPDSSTSWLMGLSGEADGLRDLKGSDLPERPKGMDEFPERVPDQLRAIETPADWALPVLKAKVTLDMPKDKKRLVFSDALTALSQASGFSIVCEDFESHRNSRSFYDGRPVSADTRAAGIFVGSTTLGDALRTLSSYSVRWFINEDDKLIVGWAGNWRGSHQNLVPARVLDNLAHKLNGTGAELDDVIPQASFTYEQRKEWIEQSYELLPARWFRSDGAWKLYAALSDANKALAKSELGLPLSGFDSSWLSGYCTYKLPFYDRLCPKSIREERAAEEQLKNDYLTNPDLLRTLTLRVVLERPEITTLPDGGYMAKFQNCIRYSSEPAKTDDLRSYCLEFRGRRNGEEIKIVFDSGGVLFPIYSKQRQEELKAKSSKSRSINP